ncbi:YhjD/YihY/BrkB family envelope integrity protein [Kitasatospora sp. NPDC101157]|uniref:YhjD/YihY/BrkB family envelope integrity protein n=1 Tax=Kitasatospora sp. NPDC101157 TaxID=3364098 RepID=UPI003801CDEA
MGADDRWGVRHVRRAVESGRKRFSGTWAGVLWQRLQEIGFMNLGIQFAATLLLCFFPFMIVANALVGRSTVTELVRHLGLDHQASTDVSALFASSTATSRAVTGAASVFFVLGGIAAAAALQQLYQRLFELPRRGTRDLPHQVLALALLMTVTPLSTWVLPAVRGAGGPVLLGAFVLAVATALWWLLMWILLAGRVPWRDLLPSAVVTGLCYLGMRVVFEFTASDMVTEDARKYGPIGVVFFLMSWLVAIGVVIILGAVTGIVWRERGLSVTTGLKGLPRPGKRGRG